MAQPQSVPKGWVPDGWVPDNPAPPASASVPVPPPKPSFLSDLWSSTKNMVGGAYEASPFALAGALMRPSESGAYYPYAGVIRTVGDIAKAGEVQRQKGVENVKQGDFLGAAGRFGAWLGTWMGGPALANLVDEVKAGRLDRASGQALMLASPFAARALPVDARIPGVMRSKNPELARAAEMALQEDVPLDLGTATGNKWAQRLKFATDAMTPMGLIDRVTPAAKAFTRLGTKLEQQARPGLAATAETAGSATRRAVEHVVDAFEQKAKPFYEMLERIENDPKNIQNVPVAKPVVNATTGKMSTKIVMKPMPVPVDMRPFKAKLGPVLERMDLDPYYTVERKASDPGYTAVKLIVTGPDHIPLSVARTTASVFGKEQVGTGALGKRTGGEGLAAKVFTELHKAIETKARSLGPEAVTALKEGNFNWSKARTISEMMEEVQVTGQKQIVEPVKLFQKLVAPGDGNIKALDAIKAALPADSQVPQNMGRAWLEDHLTAATTHGGMDKTQAFLSEWDRLGPRTKEWLFPDKGVHQRVNDFVVIMREWGKSPNPSGTGGINAIMRFLQQGTRALAAPAVAGQGIAAHQTGYMGAFLAEQGFGSLLNAGLHNPTIVKALVQGMTVPVRGPVRGAGIAGAVAASAQLAPNVPRIGPVPSPSLSAPLADGVWELGPDGQLRFVR